MPGLRLSMIAAGGASEPRETYLDPMARPAKRAGTGVLVIIQSSTSARVRVRHPRAWLDT